MRVYLIEAIGTFFLAFAALMTGNPLAIGLTLMAMLYCGAHISGGHYNPAVTFAVWLRSGIGKNWVTGYLLAQFVGALAAAFFVHFLTGNIPMIQPVPGMELWKGMGIEALLTAVLCFVILSVLFADKLRNNDIYGLAIGFTLTALIFTGSALSGAVFNPAIASGILIFQGIKTEVFLSQEIILYVAGPLIGGAVASYGFQYFND